MFENCSLKSFACLSNKTFKTHLLCGKIVIEVFSFYVACAFHSRQSMSYVCDVFLCIVVIGIAGGSVGTGTAPRRFLLNLINDK